MLSSKVIRVFSVRNAGFVWRGAGSARRVRFVSSTTAYGNIPAPPSIPVVEVPTPVKALDPSQLPLEPTFESMNLGGYSPIGIVQSSLEYLHVGLGMPWWATIVTGTVCVRLLLTPIVILSQRNSAKMTNCMPRMQELQKDISDARQMGDPILGTRRTHELSVFMKANNISPIKNAMLPMAQFPFFVSFFIGLRRMANTPVESMTNGGLFWFTDLTMPDQFYLLPVMTSLTMWATIEMGLDGKVAMNNASLMKYAIKAIPLVMLPFTINFSSAILCYWLSTNTVSLIQVSVLKIPAVRKYLKIPETIEAAPSAPKDKNFIATAKDTWKNMKMTREVENRYKKDEQQFNRAGRGPLVKTYKFDPTLVTVKKSK